MPTKLEDFKRATHVVRVLHKHGLGSLIRQAGLMWHLHLLDRHRIKEVPPDVPRRLCEAMEELGGTFIKLGQLLSIRPDLVPPEYCAEFSKLQDSIEPEPFEVIETTIQEQLGRPTQDVFTHIERECIGSASIAQVHKAKLRNGKAAVIKVQRPNIRKTFEEDIDILKYLAKKIDKHVGKINLTRIIEEFQSYTKRELDFLSEADNIRLLRQTQKLTPNVIIPAVYDEYTTPEMIVMEYLDGTKISQIKDKTLRRVIAKNIIDSTFTHIFEKGIFHADLHPGNILYLKNKKIGLLDYGIVGSIDKDTIDLGIKLYTAIHNRNAEQISDILLTYGEITQDTDTDAFKEEVRAYMTTFNTRESITHTLYKMFMLCGKHRIQLPKDAVLIGKSLVTAEGTAKELDPDYDFVSYAENRIIRIMQKRRTQKRIITDFIEKGKAMSETLTAMPKESLELIRKIKSGRAVLELDDKKFRHLGFDINNSSNRISYALIAASSILAGSQLHNVPPFIQGYSLPVVLTYFVATIFIILLATSIFREKYDVHG